MSVHQCAIGCSCGRGDLFTPRIYKVTKTPKTPEHEKAPTTPPEDDPTSVTTPLPSKKEAKMPEHLAKEELETTNEYMAHMQNLFRDPPTREERIEHEQILETLPDNQKVGVGMLADIIRQQKGGDILLSRDLFVESSLWLMPLLMTSDWFRASDMLCCEIPLPESHFPENNTDLSEEQLREKVFSSTLELKDVVVKALKIDPSKVSVKAPEVTGHTGNFTVVAGKPVLEVKVNAKGMDFQEPIEINNIKLTKIEQAKANQIPVFVLKPEDFDPKGDFQFPCKDGDTQERGGMTYKQPCSNWVRIGLSVSGRFDNGNDDWLGMDGNPNEWTVGFHGSSVEGMKNIAASREIRSGARQMFCDDVDINSVSDRFGLECGVGAYFADDIEIAKRYAADIRGLKCVFQARLYPSKVRVPEGYPMFRIVNQAEYARPYGICVEFRKGKEERVFERKLPEERGNVEVPN